MLLVMVCLLGAAGADVLPEVWKDIVTEYIQQEGPGCPGCEVARGLLGGPYLNLTRAYHLERAKARILEELGLLAPPQHPPSPLPVPVRQGQVFASPATPRPHTPSRQRLVLTPSEVNCEEKAEGVLEVRLRFAMPEAALVGDLLSGRLWLEARGGLLSASLSTSRHPDQKHMHSSSSGGGWLESDVSVMLREKEENFLIKVISPPENVSTVDCSFYQDISQRALISIDTTTDDNIDAARGKRNVNCVEGLSECCREKLFVSFDKIGWGEWIIQPRGYHAYYCKGTCANTASLAVSGSPFHSVIKKFQMEGHKLDIIPCCTPTRLSPVQLIYRDNNGTYIQKIIPNLTVEACGCM